MEAVEPVADLQALEGAFYQLLTEQVATRCMLDVGAHHGTSLRPFLEAGWVVYAFEPIEANRKRLDDYFPAHPQLTVRPEAVSSENGSAVFHLAVHPDGTPHDFYHSLERIGDDPWHRKGRDVTVPVVSLGALVASGELPTHVGFLKIDTEGHDLAVLRGLGALTSEVIGVEFWCDGHALGRSPSPPDEMVRLLKERGYPFYLVIRHRGVRTDVERSSLESIGGSDWGNLVFFRADQAELYQRIAARLDRPGHSFDGSHATRRIRELLRAAYPYRDGLNFIDVGAFRGAFTAEILNWFPASSGLLFEPSSESNLALRERYAGNAAVTIADTALSSRRGTAAFYRSGPAYNNSLLQPVHGDASMSQVTVDTLDDFLVRQQWAPKTVDLLKVDAQGHEFQILRGATATLRKYQPAVVVEVFFADHYSGQDSYCDIFQFMKESGYRLAAMLQTHAARGGVDCFADALFLPAHLYPRVSKSAQEFICLDSEHLLSQNEFLQKTCEERLQLIHQLNEVAEERLRRMHALQAALDRRFLKRCISWARRRIGGGFAIR